MGFNRNQSESESTDPRLTQAYLDNLSDARDVAESLPQREFAQPTDTFRAGREQMLSNTGISSGGQASWQPGMDAAMQGAQGVMGSTPQAAGAASFLQGDIGAYMNPYQDQVIDRAMGDLDRSRQMAMNDMGDRAAAAGAFGGSRHGVAEAETNRGFFDQMGNMSAQLRQQGFDTASGMMGQDLGRQQQTSLANLNAQMQGRQQQLGASGLLGQLSGQQRDMAMGDTQALMNLGLGEQQFAQQQLDAPRNQLLQQQELINQALGLVPGGTGGTSTSSGFGVSLPTPAG